MSCQAHAHAHAPRSLDVMLGNDKLTIDVNLQSERSNIQAALLSQVCSGRTTITTGRDHQIILDLSGTDRLFWRRSGRRDITGSSAPSSIAVVPAFASDEWDFTPSNKLHVFVPDRDLRARIDDLGQDGAKAEVPDVFAHEDPTVALLLTSIYQDLSVHHGDTLLQNALHAAIKDAMIARYVEGISHEAINRAIRLQNRPMGDPRMARTIDYIEAHLGEALNVGEIAAVAAMSPSHFARAFRATTGEPVWAFVQRRRCERARALLATTRLPIAEVAFQTGFAGQAHLTTSLRRRYGATPGDLRRDAGA